MDEGKGTRAFAAMLGQRMHSMLEVGIPDFENGKLKGCLDTVLWPDIKRYLPNPLLMKNPSLQDYQLAGTPVLFWCPARFFRRHMEQWQGSVIPPCPHCKSNTHVKPDGWMRVPRRVACLDLVMWLLSSSWRCSCRKAFFILFHTEAKHAKY